MEFKTFLFCFGLLIDGFVIVVVVVVVVLPCVMEATTVLSCDFAWIMMLLPW